MTPRVAALVGFCTAALFIPLIAGAATTPRWAFLSIALPLVLLFWRKNAPRA